MRCFARLVHPAGDRFDEDMDRRRFAERADLDGRLRSADGHSAQNGTGGNHDSRGLVAAKAELLFVVSRADARTYTYLAHAMAAEGVAVILDRRAGERRQSRHARTPDRRDGERRSQDITAALRLYGWAIVHRDKRLNEYSDRIATGGQGSVV
jgi:hypothetical protein